MCPVPCLRIGMQSMERPGVRRTLAKSDGRLERTFPPYDQSDVFHFLHALRETFLRGCLSGKRYTEAGGRRDCCCGSSQMRRLPHLWFRMSLSHSPVRQDRSHGEMHTLPGKTPYGYGAGLRGCLPRRGASIRYNGEHDRKIALLRREKIIRGYPAMPGYLRRIG